MNEKYKQYPLKNPIEDVSQTSRWKSTVMKIVDLVQPIDKKTNVLDIKAATKIIKSVYDDALADAVIAIKQEMTNLDSKIGLSDHDKFCFNASIAAIKALEEKNGM